MEDADLEDVALITPPQPAAAREAKILEYVGFIFPTEVSPDTAKLVTPRAVIRRALVREINGQWQKIGDETMEISSTDLVNFWPTFVQPRPSDPGKPWRKVRQERVQEFLNLLT